MLPNDTIAITTMANLRTLFSPLALLELCKKFDSFNVSLHEFILERDRVVLERFDAAEVHQVNKKSLVIALAKFTVYEWSDEKEQPCPPVEHHCDDKKHEDNKDLVELPK